MHLFLDLILLGLGVGGLVLAWYMTAVFVRVRRGESVRCVDGTCPVVMQTPYAQSLGFPNSYLAIPFYALVTLFAALQLTGQGGWLFVPVAAATALSVLMSAYLVYALLWKLQRV